MKNIRPILLLLGISFSLFAAVPPVQSFFAGIMMNPLYDIDLITNDADGDGVGDSLGVAVDVIGVVYGIDLQGGSSIQFTLIDGTGGIGVFSSNNFNYTVTEGDSLRLSGTVSQFNGLTQINPDTLIVLGSGSVLQTPAVVTTLDETTESELVRFNNATLVNPADWPTTTGSQNFDVTNGTDTITVRVDSDTDIDGTPAPTGAFDIIGLGGQFDSSVPRTEGYQLLPRSLNDIILLPFTSGLPIYDIDLVTNDADNDGIGDSLGVACELRGVVYGIDIQGGSSVSFTFIDGTGGIALFSSNSFGYTVTEGDSVHIPGTISQFNGLTQMNPDTIVLISQGNTLRAPVVVTTLDETTESEFVRFNNAYLVNPADWPTTSGSTNFDITNGSDTITIRVDSDTDIDGTPGPPSDTFNVVGLGGQFDSSVPRTEGYQLLPRAFSDFLAIGTSGLPIYPIDLVTNDANNDGEGDSVGVSCELRGVVYGIDLQGSGSIQFTFIDNTGGIGLFSSNNFGYTVREGDSVHVPGTISQFNGLTQMNPDTIIVVDSMRPLRTPAVITTLDETTESEFIRFNSAYLVNPADWPTSTGSTNFDITNGSDTITIRVDSDTDIDGTPGPPADTFDVVGLGGQFDSSVPRTEGYQLLPRAFTDFIPVVTSGLPVYPIGLVTADADADGVGDSLGVACELRGVVYGIDLQGSGSIQFTFIDGTGGIGLFSSNNFGYTVREGDSVHVPGSISVFNGLTQMSPDTIILVDSMRPLQDPAVITSLDETTESEFIRFNRAYLVDTMAWPTTSGSANFDITNGSDTITIRVDSDTDIDGTPGPPADTFDVVGLGGQFDSSDPRTEGYQLLPRAFTDFIPFIPPTPPPLYPIGLITDDADNDGLGDSLGVTCRVQGLVYGIDFQGGDNISFTVIDSTGGINAFQFDFESYVVTEGDEVEIAGEIIQFNGLTEISIDTVIVLSTGNAIADPVVVTALDETTESEFVRLECLILVDTTQWPQITGSQNIQVSNGVDTFVVRIDSDTDIDGTPVPSSPYLNITGIGGQFDGSGPPYLSGYQLFPRSLGDIEARVPEVSFVRMADTVQEGTSQIPMEIFQQNGNPENTSFTIQIDTAASTATPGTDLILQFPGAALSGCDNDTASLPLDIIDDAAVEADETVVINIISVTNDGVIGASQLSIVIEDNDTDNVEGLAENAIKLYPNPTTGLVKLNATVGMQSISLRNLMGQEVMKQSANGFDAELNVNNLPEGMYIVRVETLEGVWTSRLMKK